MSRKRLGLAVGVRAGEPDPAHMEAATQDFLLACGLDPGETDLQGTAARVARLWREEFLAGYQLDPAEILDAPIVGEPDPALVLAQGLRFHAMCPHHLLPYRGVAAVAYLPAGKLAGFGRIATLVDCFTRRVTLQERATHQIAQALMAHLGARGAGCVLRAEQLCLALPGERHDRSEVTTSVFLGELLGRPDLQERLLAAVQVPRAPGAGSGRVPPRRRRRG